MNITAGLRSFVKDLLDLRVLIIKLVYFSLLSGVVIIWPQLTIHQQQLGLTTYQTGICGSVTSAIAIVVPLLAGFTGDKLGNYKILMSVSEALAAIGAFLFTIVPSAKTTINVDFTNGTPTSDSGFDNSTTSVDDLNSSTTTAGDFNRSTTTLEVDSEKLTVTFWSYLATRVLLQASLIVGYTLFEAAVMAHVQKMGVDYGFQRVWGTLAVFLSSLGGGYIVEATGSFNMIFYMSAVLHLVSAALMMLLTMDFKQPSQSLTRDILKYLRNPEAIMLFCALLAAGAFLGYLETFMYRFLFSLGASTLLIGLTETVRAPFQSVLTLITSYFVRLVGHVPLIVIGLFTYVIRLVGLGFLEDPWLVLPLEALECVSNGLLFTASIMYCTVLFSVDTIATFRGLFSVVHFGVGKLLGTLIGSEIREAFGDRATFQVLAGAALTCCLTYSLAFYFLTTRRSKGVILKDSIPPPLLPHAHKKPTGGVLIVPPMKRKMRIWRSRDGDERGKKSLVYNSVSSSQRRR